MKQVLRQLKDQCTVPLPLNFFGHHCVGWLHPDDLGHARFLFRHHIGSSSVEHKTHVLLYAESGFFASLLEKDFKVKTVIGVPTDRSEQIFFRQFQGWSGAPSVLPPFFANDLRKRFSVSPGSVLTLPNQTKGWILRGANYVGKTSLAVALCRRGFGLVSDHLVIQNRDTGICAGYHSPIGLRRQNYRTFKMREDLANITYLETVSEDTGPVALAHLEDLVPGAIAPGFCEPVSTISLLRVENKGTGKPNADLIEASHDRASKTVTLRVPSGLSPDIIAEKLAREGDMVCI